MGVKYIVIIAICALFGLMFLIWLGKYIYNKNKFDKQRSKIVKMYNDKNLAKMEYDFANYDDRVERLISASHTEGQLSIDDLMLEAPASAPDEGLEEITGNYKPE